MTGDESFFLDSIHAPLYGIKSNAKAVKVTVTYPAINYEWNEYNFYCSKLTKDNNLRSFSLKSLKATVLP